MCEYPSYSLALYEQLLRLPQRKLDVRVVNIDWQFKHSGRFGTQPVQVHRMYRVMVRPAADRYGVSIERWLVEAESESEDEAREWSRFSDCVGMAWPSTCPELFARRCLAVLGVNVRLSHEKVMSYIPWCNVEQLRRVRLVSINTWGGLRFASCVASTFRSTYSYRDSVTGQMVDDEGVADLYITPIGIVTFDLLFTEDMSPSQFVRRMAHERVADLKTLARAIRGYEPEASLVALRLGCSDGRVRLL